MPLRTASIAVIIGREPACARPVDMNDEQHPNFAIGMNAAEHFDKRSNVTAGNFVAVKRIGRSIHDNQLRIKFLDHFQ